MVTFAYVLLDVRRYVQIWILNVEKICFELYLYMLNSWWSDTYSQKQMNEKILKKLTHISYYRKVPLCGNCSWKIDW